jgi:hypothetical protein
MNPLILACVVLKQWLIRLKPGSFLLSSRVKEGKADAVLAASIFHFAEYSVQEAKQYMQNEGIEVRLT